MYSFTNLPIYTQYRLAKKWELSRKDDGSVDLEYLDRWQHLHYLGKEAVALMASRLDLNENSNVLDIGCGVGGAARYLAQNFSCNITGIDVQAALLKISQDINQTLELDKKITLVNGDALHEKFDGQRFDVWFCILVLVHLKHRKELLSHVKSLLKPQGKFYLEDFIVKSELSRNQRKLLEQIACPMMTTKAEFVEELRHCGYQNIQTEDVTSIWEPWVQQRFQNLLESKAQFINQFGKEDFEHLSFFYGCIASLFEERVIGGIRIWGSATQSIPLWYYER